jgi:hypothetical protein
MTGLLSAFVPLLSLRYTGPHTLLHKLVGLHDTVGSVRPQSDNKAVQYSLSYYYL